LSDGPAASLPRTTEPGSVWQGRHHAKAS